MSLTQRDDGIAGTERMIDVLARLHGELEDIAVRIDHNQAAIARTTWAAGADDADYLKAMQDADLSAQRIAGVAGFLRALGDAAQPHWRVDTTDATDALTLSDLIRTIGKVDDKGVQTKNAADAGEVDFF